DGAAAEYLVIPAAFLAPKPRTLTHVESATLPLAGLSAWQGLLDHGRLEPGQRVLIHGATGGVGSLAIQLASAHGAHVIATTSSAHGSPTRASCAPQSTASSPSLRPRRRSSEARVTNTRARSC